MRHVTAGNPQENGLFNVERTTNLFASIILIVASVFFFGDLTEPDGAFVFVAGVLSFISYFHKNPGVRMTVNFILGMFFLAVFCILFAFRVDLIDRILFFVPRTETKYLLFHLFFSAFFFYNSWRQAYVKTDSF